MSTLRERAEQARQKSLDATAKRTAERHHQDAESLLTLIRALGIELDGTCVDEVERREVRLAYPRTTLWGGREVDVPSITVEGVGFAARKDYSGSIPGGKWELLAKDANDEWHQCRNLSELGRILAVERIEPEPEEAGPRSADEILWGEDAAAVRAAADAMFGHHPERGGPEREQAAYAMLQAVKPILANKPDKAPTPDPMAAISLALIRIADALERRV